MPLEASGGCWLRVRGSGAKSKTGLASDRGGLTRTCTEQSEQDPEGKSKGGVPRVGVRWADSRVTEAGGQEREALATRVSHRMSRRQESPGLSKCVVRTPNRTHSLVTGQPPSGGAVSAGVMASAQRGWEGPGPLCNHLLGATHSWQRPTVRQSWPPPFRSTHSNPTFLNKMFSAVV